MKDALSGIGEESDWANLKFSEPIPGYPREIELRKTVGLQLRRQLCDPRVLRDDPYSPLRAFGITIAVYSVIDAAAVRAANAGGYLGAVTSGQAVLLLGNTQFLGDLAVQSPLFHLQVH